MNIFIYSDESGVFDNVHNDYFVFAGIMFLSKEEKDVATHKYMKAEKTIRIIEEINDRNQEIKASSISNKSKGKLFRSLNQIEKFGVVIDEKRILQKIWLYKKSKQRYLDWAYKMALKKKFEYMIENGQLDPDSVENLYVFVDEHSTATDGKYELRESLEQEFKYGTYNLNFSHFYPPIFSNLKSVTLHFCNSSSQPLIRAADIVANKLFYWTNTGTPVSMNPNFHIHRLP